MFPDGHLEASYRPKVTQEQRDFSPANDTRHNAAAVREGWRQEALARETKRLDADPFVQQTRAAVALHQKLAAELGYPDLTKPKETTMAKTHETKHEVKEHKQQDLWHQTIETGRAVQQAAEAQKAPTQTKQADNQREV